MGDNERETARRTFLASAGWTGAEILLLPPDASFRRYFRIHEDGRAAMLMDAPPQENVRAFVQVAEHLTALGLRVPQVYSHDLQSGFGLLEDLGDDTFTRLLAAGSDERILYRRAVEVLGVLQTHPQATNIDVPRYDSALLVDEVLRLIDWYYPDVRGEAAPAGIRREFADLWHAIFAALPPLAPTLVLRDYHVDNLISVEAADGTTQCGLLDFQDAVIGSPAYDLMSLLEDARRDVPCALVEEMKQHYHHVVQTADRHAFELHFHALAAQRHCKVLGNFARLCRRDGKCAYLAHIPRVVGLLQRHLSTPLLQPLQRWLDTHLPMRHEAQVSPN